MITGNPLSPEIKQQIDIIKNNPNTSPEKKQEQFGLLMGGLREQFGGPPLKPMNRPSQEDFTQEKYRETLDKTYPEDPRFTQEKYRETLKPLTSLEALKEEDVNMQPDVNINDINNARSGGGLHSQRMNFESDQQFEKDFPTDDLPNYTQTSRESITPPQQPPMQQPQPMKQQPGMLSGMSDWMGEQKNKLGEYLYAGKDQQGMFGPTGVNPKNGQDRGSMGLGGAFGRIFNDPRRMAMLAGGLTAMDQNSYYDKEGFSSPWSGLRAGLGGAQAGYKSVIDRRKAEAETALAKAKTKWYHLPVSIVPSPVPLG